MSLVRLLATGKSLVGLHDSNSRYRMRSANPLPKFGSKKNPFAEKPAVTPRLTPAEIAAANLKKTQPLPVVKTEVRGQMPEVSTNAESEMRIVKSSFRIRVLEFVRNSNSRISNLNPFKNRKPMAAKRTMSQFSKTPMQTEFSLDHVKVMRNDLSDVDVEVVAVKARPTRETTAPAAVPDLPPAKNSWEYLGERLLRKS
jgi:hypothetical protein